MEEFPPKNADSLSRRELQYYLKKWNRKATGTNASLRQAFQETHKELYGVVPTLPSDNNNIESKTQEVTSSAVASLVTSQYGIAKIDVASGEKKKNPIKEGIVEKRAKRFRSKPTIGICQRIERAKSQRLYLVERSEDINEQSLSCDFVVLGSTGNVYTVKICQIPSCTCPDHMKGNLCKHILFVLLKVVGLDSKSPLVYQAALLKSELHHIFSLLSSRRVGGSVMANQKVQKSYASLKSGDDSNMQDEDIWAKRKSLDDDADCPICFENLNDGGSNNKLTFCRATCGTNFHAECIQRWLGQLRGTATCPNCRQPWEDGTTTSKEEGYTNLGSLQGQSRQRDDSTYSEWYLYAGSTFKRRRWE